MNGHNEEQALDALIAIALRSGINDEVSDAEIDQHMKNPKLNAEEEQAFTTWKKTSVAQVLGKLGNPQASTAPVSEELYAAMNRKNAEDKHDELTEEELNRLRTKMLDEEEKQ